MEFYREGYFKIVDFEISFFEGKKEISFNFFCPFIPTFKKMCILYQIYIILIQMYNNSPKQALNE